jgi:hypothetical protein
MTQGIITMTEEKETSTGNVTKCAFVQLFALYLV